MRLRLAIAVLALVAACTEVPPAPVVAPVPEARPEPRPAPEPAPPAAEPSQASRDLALYYGRLENDLSSRGLLRGDGGGPDTPFTASMLARNFIRIALYDEYSGAGPTLSAQEQESVLRRWDRPVRMQVDFGATVPEAQRAQDRASVASFSARIARITGLSITQVPEGGNFHVLFMGEDDRRPFADTLRRLVPGIADSSIRAFVDPGRSTLCLVISFSDGSTPGYTNAVAMIRAEHPSLLRTACIHEEIAQGLGLPNDSPAARPSIFNDDDEFARLTTHDELLLRMLYDPRMRTGMTLEEAAPLARTMAEELVGGTG